MFRRIVAFALAAVLAVPGWAQTGAAVVDTFVVDDVRVEGLRRFDPGIIFSRLDIDVGDTFAPGDAAPLLRELYQSGHFKSVEILRDGGVLVIRVSENPVIAEIRFSGLEELEDERLLEILRDAGIAKSRVFDRSKLAEAAQGIEEIYASRHFYNAKVKTVVSPLPRNRAGVVFEVDEGDEVVVKSIEIEGNEEFGDWTLRRLMEMKTRGLLNFFSDDYRFSQGRLDADMERIRTLYLENGYLRFAIEESTELTEDKKGINIKLMLDEGRAYSVSEYVLERGGEEAEKPFAEFATQFEGEIYNSELAADAVVAYREHLQDLGYALARVDFDTEIDDSSGKVRVVFNAAAGVKVQVRRIDIIGNEQTADEVIRREFLQLEQEVYSRAKIESSRRRLRRLGYFRDVRVEIQRIAEADDQVDLIITVDEGGLGDIRIGAGFGTDGGISFNGSFNAPNIFGSGDDFRIAGSFSDTAKSFSTGIDQPYHTDEGISRHFSLSYGENEAEEGATGYKIDGYSATYGYGFPFVDDGRYEVRGAYKKTQLDNTNPCCEVTVGVMSMTVAMSVTTAMTMTNMITPPMTIMAMMGEPAMTITTTVEISETAVTTTNTITTPTLGPGGYRKFVAQQGTDYNIAELQFDLIYDTRDSSTLPTDGNRLRIDSRIGVPLFDLRYYKMDLTYDSYHELPNVWTKPIFHFRAGLGYGGTYGGDEYPFFERYTLGGTNKNSQLRGFQSGSIGALRVSDLVGNDDHDALGGKSRLYGSMELPIETAFFGTQKVFLAPFVDAGAIGGFDKASRLGAARVSGGIELRWLSPIGPLRFSYVRPIRKQPNDKTEDFQFTVSTF